MTLSPSRLWGSSNERASRFVDSDATQRRDTMNGPEREKAPHPKVRRTWGTLALILLAGCAHADGTVARTVVVVGDSITARSATAIRARLEPDYHATVVGFPGYRFDQALPALTERMAGKPRVVVVELGTNNGPDPKCHCQTLPVDWRPDLARVVSLAERARCVAFVTVATNLDVQLHTDYAEQIDDALQDAVTAHARWSLIDWDTAVKNDPSLWDTDHIHPSPAGAQWLATQVRAVAERC